MKHKAKNIAVFAFKLSVAVAALWYVLSKSELSDVLMHLKSVDYRFVVLGCICFIMSSICGGLRLKQYFLAENFELGKRYSVVLYFIGSFFNTFLPGGIGGDGYVAVHLKKLLKIPAMQTVRLLFSARVNGLFFLNIFFFYFLLSSEFNSVFPYEKLTVALLFLLQIPVYFFVSRKILKESFKTFVKAGKFSFLLQAFSVTGALCCFYSIGITEYFFEFLAMFLGAAVAAVVPITPGGAGVREFVYYQGAIFLGFDAERAIAASLVYFGVYFVSSLAGLVLYLALNKIDPKR